MFTNFVCKTKLELKMEIYCHLHLTITIKLVSFICDTQYCLFFPLTASLSHLSRSSFNCLCLCISRHSVNDSCKPTAERVLVLIQLKLTILHTYGWGLLKLTTVRKLDTSWPFQMHVKNVLPIRICSPVDTNGVIIYTDTT